MSFLDKEGLIHLWNQIIARLNGKIEREEFETEIERLDSKPSVSVQMITWGVDD